MDPYYLVVVTIVDCGLIIVAVVVLRVQAQVPERGRQGSGTCVGQFAHFLDDQLSLHSILFQRFQSSFSPRGAFLSLQFNSIHFQLGI